MFFLSLWEIEAIVYYYGNCATHQKNLKCPEEQGQSYKKNSTTGAVLLIGEIFGQN